jgi:5-methylcytosine-specific restriction endonuclease McrA
MYAYDMAMNPAPMPRRHAHKLRSRLQSFKIKHPDHVQKKISNKDLIRLINSACSNCGSREKIVMDHIIPLSRGGYTGIGNLQTLCGKCNASKGGKLQAEFRHKRKLSAAFWLALKG